MASIFAKKTGMFIFHPGNYSLIGLLAFGGALLIQAGLIAGFLTAAIATAIIAFLFSLFVAFPLFMILLKTAPRGAIQPPSSLESFMTILGTVGFIAGLVLGIGYLAAPATFAFMAPAFALMTGALGGGLAGMASVSGLAFLASLAAPLPVMIIAIFFFASAPFVALGTMGRLIGFLGSSIPEGGGYDSYDSSSPIYLNSYSGFGDSGGYSRLYADNSSLAPSNDLDSKPNSYYSYS